MSARCNLSRLRVAAKRRSVRTLAIVPPVVDQLTLGPIGTNCYVVRADRSAAEAVVVDPSGSATEIRLRLASLGARCVAILVTHGHFDHVLGLADLAEGDRRAGPRAGGRAALLESPRTFAPPGIASCAAGRPRSCSTAARRSSSRACRFDVISVPGHSPGHVAYAVDGRAALRRRALRRARSAGPTFPAPTGRRCSRRSRRSSTRTPAETVVHPGHGPATTLGAELARTRSSPTSGASARRLPDERAGDGSSGRAGRTTSSRPRCRSGSGSPARSSDSARSTATGGS